MRQPVYQSTLGIETSSSVQVIETTSTTTLMEPSAMPAMHSDFSDSSSSTSTTSSSVTQLEPSRSSSTTTGVDLTSSLSTPTNGLSTTSSIKATSSNGAPQRTNQPITNSITFSKGQSKRHLSSISIFTLIIIVNLPMCYLVKNYQARFTRTVLDPD